jgi:F-box domain
MPQLPHDVWTLIAGFLPLDHLLTLAAVNRSFLHIILDARYGEIHWVKLDKYLLKTLIHLQCVSHHIYVRGPKISCTEIHLLQSVSGGCISGHGLFNTWLGALQILSRKVPSDDGHMIN